MSINRTNDFSSSTPRLGLSTQSTQKAAAVEQKKTEATTPAAAPAMEATEKTPASAATVSESRSKALAGEDAIRARLFGGEQPEAASEAPRLGLDNLDGQQFAAAKPKPKPRPRPTGSTSMAENNGAPRGPGDGPETGFA